ncbi:unnamed protein product [Prorocentrum cordatum]|uniref:Pseudouridine synthase RsuA/RluA-like domain-containing protein n=1 Tax=Prorocentrum cordatum TaxID=2364126 RepID=A0ABN9W559_9DINO|nr:unnamed protein product [Polarella glacialis]
MSSSGGKGWSQKGGGGGRMSFGFWWPSFLMPDLRWCAVLKPYGFAVSRDVAAAFPRPSVETTLRPFLGEGRELGFPLGLHRAAEGLLLVTTDGPMLRCFSDVVRQRRVVGVFRVLAGIPPAAARHTSRALLDAGGGVLQQGALVSGDSAEVPAGGSGAHAEGSAAAATQFVLESGPRPSAAWPGLSTAVFLARPSAGAGTAGANQLREDFARAGCPVLFDPRHCPTRGGESVPTRSSHGIPLETVPSIGVGAMGLQLQELEFPHPFRTGEAVRISLRAPPKEWAALHAPDVDADTSL